MRIRIEGVLCIVLLLGPSASSTATELSECVTLSVNPSGDAVLTNGCGSVLNITYCVDNARSDKSCSNTALGVTTLSAGGSDLIAAYIDGGAGPVYWAVCVYPEAVLDWKPGAAAAYVCKKTCVMC